MSEFVYNIGDTVEITPYLQRYADIQTHDDEEFFTLKKDVVDEMLQFAGKTAVINDRSNSLYIGYWLDVDDRSYKWHQDLLRPAKKRISIEEML